MRLLHLALGISAISIAIVLGFLRLGLGIAPLDPADSTIPAIAYGTSAAAIGALAVAFLIMRPRVPTRTLGQSDDAYWSSGNASQSALLVWALLEGAGTIAAVGYFLTGSAIPVIVMIAALVAYWLSGPSTFSRA